MTGKLTSELEKVLRNLKEKRQEERDNYIAQVRDGERRIRELLEKLDDLKKLNEEEHVHLVQKLKQQKAKASNEVGIANEKVRIVEDDNLKFQAELEALKQQLSMEKKLRASEKDSFEKKVDSLGRNADNILNQRQRELVEMDRKMAQMQEKSTEEMSRERSRTETATQMLKNELENIISEKEAEQNKLTAQRKDKEKTIGLLKQETGILKTEVKESKKALKLQDDDYKLQLKNLDREWEEVLRRKEREKRELANQMKKLESDVAAQFSSQLKEMNEEKKVLLKRILELQRQIEETNLSHERVLVEKDEFYRKQIASLRDQHIDIETQFQMKEDELNMIKAELESEISSIASISSGAILEKTIRPEKKKNINNEGFSRKLKKLFTNKSPASSEPDLFKPHVPGMREEEAVPVAIPDETNRDESATDDKKRQILLIVTQKEETVKELSERILTSDGDEKRELESKINGLKVEIEEWRTRLK